MQKSVDAFRTISEVAEELVLPQHVLRFWETRFPQIRPLKRAGGRRYYRPADVTLLRNIRALLYDEGYTIKGVQKLLKEQGAKGIRPSPAEETAAAETDEAETLARVMPLALEAIAPASYGSSREALESLLATIEECRHLLDVACLAPQH